MALGRGVRMAMHRDVTRMILMKSLCELAACRRTDVVVPILLAVVAATRRNCRTGLDVCSQ